MDHDTTKPPPTEERDASLGRYMDAWSRLETAIHWTSQEILEIDADAGAVIWSAIATFQSIRVLEAAAKIKFNKAGRDRVSKICEQLTRRNTRRNYIVHGTWIVKIRLSFAGLETPEYSGWRRVYSHIDPDHTGDDGSDLTVEELDKTTDHVEEMVEALWKLEEDIPSLRLPPPLRAG